jgi:copper(I)-binding protein
MTLFKQLLSTILAMSLATPVLAELVAENAYVRGLPPGVDNTSAYMTLKNPGTAAVELVGAVSPVAGSVMLHTTMNHDGMLHMQHVSSATIPAQGELVLESGGMHLMLMQLQQAPKPGEQVELTLQFADGSTQTLSLPVRSVLDEQVSHEHE